MLNTFEDGNVGTLEFKITLDDLILFGVDFMEWEEEKLKELRCYYNPPESEELKPLSVAALSITEGAIYQHYKGNQYKILSVGRHSESLEEMVVYQALKGNCDVWIRPLRLFLSEITIEGQSTSRFTQM